MQSTPQATAKQSRPRKPRTKPARHIGVAVRPSEVNPFFVVKIVEGKKTDHYAVTPIPADYGTAFSVEKMGAEQEPYAVNLGDAENLPSCDCKGFLRFGHCRHVEGLTALTTAGRL
jgi:hypothetical protein